ncbi:MAG: T9SS type A sorting domain-containing protein [Bacteroidia bacterium]
MFKARHIIKIFIVALFLSFGAQAQSIDRFAIASSGGEGAGGGAQITWTCGETVTASLQGGSTFLTQGFQQLNLVNTTTIANKEVNAKINVYPIPCRDGVFINGAVGLQNNFTYSLYNALGSCVRKERITGGSLFINTEDLEDGNYFLIITNENTGNSSTHKIIKTN